MVLRAVSGVRGRLRRRDGAHGARRACEAHRGARPALPRRTELTGAVYLDDFRKRDAREDTGNAADGEDRAEKDLIEVPVLEQRAHAADDEAGHCPDLNKQTQTNEVGVSAGDGGDAKTSEQRWAQTSAHLIDH